MMMMTRMRTTTITANNVNMTTTTRMTTMRTLFLTQQPTLARCIPGRVGGDFYNYDDNNEEDNAKGKRQQ